MVTAGKILRQIPDPRGKKGRLHPLHALLGLIMLSLLRGNRSMKAAFRVGRTLPQRHLKSLGFSSPPPSHATLTQLLRILDPDAMARVFSQLTGRPLEYAVNDGQVDGQGVIDGQVDGQADVDGQVVVDENTSTGNKDAGDKVLRVLSALCAETREMAGYTFSQGKRLETSDALKLIKKTDLTGNLSPDR